MGGKMPAEYFRKWRENNKERIKLNHLAWRRRNRAKLRARARHPDAKRLESDYHKAYYQKNRDHINKRAKEYRDTNKDHVNHLQSRTRIRRFYNASIVDITKAVKRQRRRCAICRVPFAEKRPDIDHCHLTGKFRGLLCRKCNMGIGFLEDDPTIFKSAVRYLEAFKNR